MIWQVCVVSTICLGATLGACLLAFAVCASAGRADDQMREIFDRREPDETT